MDSYSHIGADIPISPWFFS